MPVILIFFLCLLHPTANGSGIGGFGIWIGGGGGEGATTTTKTPPSTPIPTLTDSYRALQAWKSSISEDPKGLLSTWVGPNVCSYKGVFCSTPPEQDSTTSASSSTQVVAIIDLNHALLKGTLVEDLSLLTHLSALHLNTNRFYGAVPNSFSNLQYLTELDLSNNIFTGPFPTPTLSIPNLAYMDLRYNKFSGEIPEELFEKELDAIFLNNNMFGGEIPESLWSSPASVVTLANNFFTGNLPATFGVTSTSGLREVLFLNNKLTGCIPEEVGFLTNAQVLDFSYNSFTGHLPSSISCLTGVEVLNIAHNQISGVVSEVVCSLRSLVNLTISFNFFSGLSGDCTKLLLRNMGFDFSGNCIPGEGMQRPEPECEDVPGVGLSCLRIPSTRPLGCRYPVVDLVAMLPTTKLVPSLP